MPEFRVRVWGEVEGAWTPGGEILGFVGYFSNGTSIFEKNRTLEFRPETLLNYRSLLE